MRSIEHAFERRSTAMSQAAVRTAVVTAGSRRSQGGVRLTRRGRLVVVLATLFVLMVAGFTLGRASSQAAGPAARSLPTVTVAPGETLWQIAARVDPGADRRALVDQIEALNHLHGDQIVAGQQLRLPRRG
jgi:nucleoid-associated protein YgaU